MTTALAERKHEIEAPRTVAMTPAEMLSRAVESGQSLEVVSKLMDLQERWEKGQARKAFDAAIAGAKAEIPVIQKNRTGHNNKRYADFAAYARAIDPILARHGLTYRFRTKQEGAITVTCIISHEMGHSEENSLTGPADKSGSKNDIQAIGSTLSYLSRYTLAQALGLAASEDDDGRASGGGGTITDEQAETLRTLITETGTNIDAFLRVAKAESISDVLASDYEGALAKLKEKKRRMEAAHA